MCSQKDNRNHLITQYLNYRMVRARECMKWRCVSLNLLYSKIIINSEFCIIEFIVCVRWVYYEFERRQLKVWVGIAASTVNLALTGTLTFNRSEEISVTPWRIGKAGGPDWRRWWHRVWEHIVKQLCQEGSTGIYSQHEVVGQLLCG